MASCPALIKASRTLPEYSHATSIFILFSPLSLSEDVALATLVPKRESEVPVRLFLV